MRQFSFPAPGSFQLHFYLVQRFREPGLEQGLWHLSTSLRLFPPIQLFGSPVPENDTSAIVPYHQAIVSHSQQVSETVRSRPKKKSELFRRQCETWRQRGAQVFVRCHDFLRKCAET